MPKIWSGSDPKCNECGRKDLHQFYDAKTKMDPCRKWWRWGILCKKCFKTHGVGLGMGLGQYYVKEGKTFVKKDG